MNIENLLKAFELITVVLPLGAGSKKLFFGLLILVIVIVGITLLCLPKKSGSTEDVTLK